jgi:Fe-S-cluster containining protein
MIYNPAEWPQKAKEKAQENFELRQFLKHQCQLDSKEIDRLVFGISERVWKVVDCTKCGNCCRVVSPTLAEHDVKRLACHLGMTPSQLETAHLKQSESTEDSPWVMRERPCPFLSDNRCTVYEHRPANCRDYPYLDKPDFIFRTLSMIGRLSECPAVFEVWEQLKMATGFRRRSR